jgi:hypothetical protein
MFNLGRQMVPTKVRNKIGQALDGMVWAAIFSIRMDKAKGVDGREIEVKSQSPTGIAMLAMFINYIDHSDFAGSSTMVQPPPFLLCHLCRSA